METVVGVGRATWTWASQPQSFAFQKPVEGIPSHHTASEDVAGHKPNLASTDAGSLRAYGTRKRYDRLLTFAAQRKGVFLLIPGLSAMAKQFASGTDGQAFPLAKSFYRLAPDFFRIWIPCSSAMSIIVLSARF